MKVRVDSEICQGHGRCFMLAPEVFSEDENGFCLIENPEVPPGLEKQALLGTEACPEHAIQLDEG